MGWRGRREKADDDLSGQSYTGAGSVLVLSERRPEELLLYLCYVFRALINSLACWSRVIVLILVDGRNQRI